MSERYNFSGISEGRLKQYEIVIEDGRIIDIQKKIHAGPSFTQYTGTIEEALEDAFKFSVAINKLENFDKMISSLNEEERNKYLKEIKIVVPKTIKS